MKKLLLTFLLALVSSIVFSQNNKIDSLQKVLLTQKEDSNKVKTLYNLGYYSEGNEQVATQYYLKAIQLAEKIGFNDGELESYFMLYMLYFYDLSNYEEALNYAFKGLQKSEIYGDKNRKLKFLNNISSTYISLGNYTKGLEYHYMGLKLAEEINDQGSLAFSLNSQAGYNIEQGNYSEALKNYFASLKIRLEIDEKWSIGQSYLNIGLVYLKQDKLDSALHYTNMGLEHYTKFDKLVDWGLPYSNDCLANVYNKMGDEAIRKKEENNAANYYEQALNLYYKAQQQHVDNNFKMEKFRLDIFIGNIYLKQKKYNLADSFLNMGIKNMEQMGVLENLSDAYLFRSQLDTTKGNWESAYKYHLKFVNLRDSTVNTENDKKLALSQVQYEFGKKEAIAKAEQEKKDIEHQRIRSIQFFSMGSLLLIAIGLYYNNRQKQKANTLLQAQKAETYIQKRNVETALVELKATQNQLIQKEKLASLGELTAGIAHEIQNPLNFVNNFSELSVDLVKDLKEEIEKPAIDKEYVNELFDDLSQNQEKINHHGKRASSIVKGMLEHSRASTGVKELTDINKLADEYLRLSYHGLRAKDNSFNADFKTDFDPTLPKIEVIPQDIGRVLMNLINNAFYAVNERAKQSRSGNFESSPNVGSNENYTPSVFLTTQQIDNQIIIKVKDNGIGMSEATKAKVFQPFFTTKPTGQGTGLGLSLAYDIVTKGHGGSLEVVSTDKVGSEFIIQLPFKNI